MKTATQTSTKSEIVYLNGMPNMADARACFPLRKRIACTDGTFITPTRYSEGPAVGDYAKRGFDWMVSVFGVREAA